MICSNCNLSILDDDFINYDCGFCLDCSFKKGYVTDKEYLKNMPILLSNVKAEVVDGKIELWQNRKHPKERNNKDERKSKEYRNWRQAVFNRDDRTCQECGATRVELHAHHIKPFAKYKELRFDVSNGITLCNMCHKLEHSKR